MLTSTEAPAAPEGRVSGWPWRRVPGWGLFRAYAGPPGSAMRTLLWAAAHVYVARWVLPPRFVHTG